MLTCSAAERLIARFADDGAALGAREQQELDEHLRACAACREALDDQRQVVRVLHGRPAVTVPAGFAARVAGRVDHDGGWLGLANWRAWTVSLAPVAAALILLAWLGIGSTPAAVPVAPAQTPASAPVTLDTWPASTAGSTSTSVFLQPMATGDALLEAVLTGADAPAGDQRDVR